jgi:hypothetical protein
VCEGPRPANKGNELSRILGYGAVLACALVTMIAILDRSLFWTLVGLGLTITAVIELRPERDD